MSKAAFFIPGQPLTYIKKVLVDSSHLFFWLFIHSSYSGCKDVLVSACLHPPQTLLQKSFRRLVYHWFSSSSGWSWEQPCWCGLMRAVQRKTITSFIPYLTLLLMQSTITLASVSSLPSLLPSIKKPWHLRVDVNSLFQCPLSKLFIFCSQVLDLTFAYTSSSF